MSFVTTGGPGQLAGQSAIVWSPADHVGAQRSHRLRVPLQKLRPAVRTRTRTTESWDYSSRTTFRASNRAHEAVAEVRHDPKGESLLQMLADGIEGATLTLYPDLTDTAWSYDVEVVSPTGAEAQLRLDEHRGLWGEFTTDLRVRKADGSEFGPELFTGLLFGYTPGRSLRRFTTSTDGGSYTDVEGASQTVASGTIRDAHWQTIDGQWQKTLKIRSADNDRVSGPFPHDIREMTVYAQVVERGAAAGTGRLFQVSDTDPRFLVRGDTGPYRVVYDDGTNTSEAALTASPSAGNRVEIRAVLNADGSVGIEQSIDGASTTSATGSGATLGTSWGNNDLGVGSLPDGTSVGDNDVVYLVAAPGVQTMDRMRIYAEQV